jgi:long-subunit fatty acid transport protein
LIAALCLLGMAAASVHAAAQSISINSSPNIVGSGARALGMGGAFIAVADDATAASWNPGGLTQLERPELSLVYNWKWYSEEFATTRFIHPDDRFDTNFSDINYFSYVQPFGWTLGGRNLVFSINYQRQYDFERRLNLGVQRVSYPTSRFGRAAYQKLDIEYKQEGGLASLTPAFALELTNQFSIGLALNIWNESLISGNEWDELQETRITTGFFGAAPLSRAKVRNARKYRNFKGTNYTLGMLYKPNDRWSLGAVYHAPLVAELDYTEFESVLYEINNGVAQPYRIPERYSTRYRIEFPSAYGLGAAYRFPNDKLTLTLDVTRRDWDEYVRIDKRGFLFMPGPIGLRGARRVSPITGLPKNQSPHDPTYSVRAGMEYVFVQPKKPKQEYLPSVRAGIFYDPEPASGSSDGWLGFNKGRGNPDDHYGVTLGAGCLVKNRVNIDAAYQYRWGTNVRRDTFGGARGVMRGFSEDVEQHLFYLSTVIYF